MELPLCVVAPGEVRVGICFFPSKTNKLLKFIEKCVCAIATSSVYTCSYCTPNTLLYWISIADLFWTGEKRITVHISHGTTTRNRSSIFKTAFCTFLWSDRHVIFTVFPETQKSPCKFHIDRFTKCGEKKWGNLLLRPSSYYKLQETFYLLFWQYHKFYFLFAKCLIKPSVFINLCSHIFSWTWLLWKKPSWKWLLGKTGSWKWPVIKFCIIVKFWSRTKRVWNFLLSWR